MNKKTDTNADTSADRWSKDEPTLDALLLKGPITLKHYAMELGLLSTQERRHAFENAAKEDKCKAIHKVLQANPVARVCLMFGIPVNGKVSKKVLATLLLQVCRKNKEMHTQLDIIRMVAQKGYTP